MIYALLIILAVFSRLIPHPANVAPIAGLALFAGATGLTYQTKQGKILAYSLPLIALLVSDALISFYTWQVMVSVYLGFLFTVGLGLLVRKYYALGTIILASLIGSIVFFLLTNAAVWAFTPMYAKTFAGLIESYTMAIPFFRNSLIGDLIYTVGLFGAYELAKRAHVPPILLDRRTHG